MFLPHGPVLDRVIEVLELVVIEILLPDFLDRLSGERVQLFNLVAQQAVHAAHLVHELFGVALDLDEGVVPGPEVEILVVNDNRMRDRLQGGVQFLMQLPGFILSGGQMGVPVEEGQQNGCCCGGNGPENFAVNIREGVFTVGDCRNGSDRTRGRHERSGKGCLLRRWCRRLFPD